MYKSFSKKVISFVLTLSLVFGLLVSLPEITNAETSGDWEYTVYGSEATVDRYNGSEKEVAVPGTLGGCPVTEIGEYSFFNKTDLKKVTIPDSVISISTLAFGYCTSLEEVSVPDSVEKIEGSFFACSSLKNITLPDSLRFIGDSSFAMCTSLTEIVIPDSVMYIGGNAFYKCTSLKSVTIPDTVTYIYDCAFLNCTSLKSVELPFSLVAIGEKSFGFFSEKDASTPSESGTDAEAIEGFKIYGYDDSLAETYAETSGIDFVSLGKSESDGKCGRDVRWELNTESGVMTISGTGEMWEYDFATYFPSWMVYLDLVKEIVIEEGVTEIKDNTFFSLVSLVSIDIPASVKTIGSRSTPAPLCTSLTCYNVASGNEFYSSENGVLYDKNRTVLIAYPCGLQDESFTVPEGVTKIGQYSFLYCIGLTDVDLGGSVTEIENGAFFFCAALNSVKMPKSVSYLDSTAFFGCENLRSVYYEGTRAELTALGAFSLPVGTVAYCSDGKMANVYFIDIEEDSYYTEPVAWAVANGITTGTSDFTFSPSDPCTRGQVVTFLWRAAGEPEPVSTDNPFKDVKESDYYYKAVLWAVENNITKGTGTDKFSPKEKCTRAQIVTFLWRAAGSPAPTNSNNPFGDVKSSDYYYSAVLWAVEKNITTGTSTTKFSPKNVCTRAQVVTFLYRGR